MTKATMLFGSILIVVGVGAYVASGAASATALIPAFMGTLILALGLLARAKPPLAKPLLIAAVLIAVLAVFGSFRGVSGFIGLLRGDEVARPLAAIAQTATLLLSLVYLTWMAVSVRARTTRIG